MEGSAVQRAATLVGEGLRAAAKGQTPATWSTWPSCYQQLVVLYRLAYSGGTLVEGAQAAHLACQEVRGEVRVLHHCP